MKKITKISGIILAGALVASISLSNIPLRLIDPPVGVINHMLISRIDPPVG